MTKSQGLISLLLSTMGIGHLFAAPTVYDYMCTIERYTRAEGDFGLTFKMSQEGFVGRQFTIDRKNGVTVGALQSGVGAVPTVIDHGSTENSYKVVSAISEGQGLPGTAWDYNHSAKCDGIRSRIKKTIQLHDQ